MDGVAGSYSFFKQEVKGWIKEHFNPSSTILDVGPGMGTYYNLLQDTYKNIDAVEIYAPNIKDYKLEEKYSNVYNSDIVDFKYDHYDLIIFGDILEHLSVEDAQKVLKYAGERCNNFIVAVPYCYKQQGRENKWETHIQDDLTKENVLERYPQLQLLYGNDRYGYYIKKDNL